MVDAMIDRDGYRPNVAIVIVNAGQSVVAAARFLGQPTLELAGRTAR